MDNLKPNRHSIRLKEFDYRNGGTYFVTICTKNKERIFGEIRNGIMGLSDIGCIVADELQKTPTIRPYIHLDRWCIMPNHLHVIFQIDEHCIGEPIINDHMRAPQRGAPTNWYAQSLNSMINHFKSAVTKRINALRDFDTSIWQRNYYEHIIRDEEERIRIRKYILENPIFWDIDPENI